MSSIKTLIEVLQLSIWSLTHHITLNSIAIFFYPRFTCDICKKDFFRKRTLVRHITKKHLSKYLGIREGHGIAL